MAFKRTRFKGTKTSTITAQQEDLANKMPKNGGGNDRPDYISITEGSNRLRFYPAHPDQKTDAFLFPKLTHWLEVEVSYEKNGESVTELKKKSIFNSRIHGDTPKDIIEEYLTFARKIAAEEMDSEEDRRTFLAPLENFSSPTNIKGQLKWVGYVDKITKDKTTFGRIDLPTSVKDQMNAIALNEDEADEVIETDPFTDPDEGRCLIVTYDKQENLPKNVKKDPKKYYTSTIDYKKVTPLTDEQLMHLETQTPLESLFKNCYRRKDFELALDGLHRLDARKFKELGNDNYGFFEDPEFQAIVDEINAYYPETDEAGEEDDKPAPKSNATTASKREYKGSVTAKELDDNMSDDLPFDIPLNKMSRVQLKGVIRREQLDIKITPSLSEEDLVDMIENERAIMSAESKSSTKEVEDELEELGTARRSGRSRTSRFTEED